MKLSPVAQTELFHLMFLRQFSMQIDVYSIKYMIKRCTQYWFEKELYQNKLPASVLFSDCWFLAFVCHVAGVTTVAGKRYAQGDS